MSYTKILQDCIDTANERQEQYGNAEDNIEDIQSCLKYALWVEITKDDIVKVLIALKLVREKNQHKKDNLIDLINYAAILQHIQE